MRVLIIAVNHQIQPAQIISASTNGTLERFEQDQKERFGELLRECVRDRGVQIVGEEARHGQHTVAQRVCQQEGCRHANIDMTPEQRACRNIPPGYYETDDLSEAEKARCNREREEHMVARVLAEAGDANSVLVICGRIHMTAIGTQLTGLRHTVERIDLQDEDWYIEDWVQHMLEL